MRMSAAFRSMRGPHDGAARGFSPGPTLQPQDVPPEPESRAANDNHGSGPSRASALPPDASAIIEPVPIAVNQSGRVQGACGGCASPSAGARAPIR